MLHSIDIFSSVLASTLRAWKGTSGSKSIEQPDDTLILFDQEGCPECRFVREALTELNLNVVIAPCPVGGKNIRKLRRDSGSDEIPLLIDNNTGEKLRGRIAIVKYLFKQFRNSDVPSHLQSTPFNDIGSKIASLIRFNAGIKAKEAITAEKPLTLYSFESSPFSRPVRELLCELELPYLLVNLGKQQWADMGPANPRLIIGGYKPLKNSKRDNFFQEHGNVQVPYLVDPNTGKELFESKDIIAYLKETYLISD